MLKLVQFCGGEITTYINLKTEVHVQYNMRTKEEKVSDEGLKKD